LIDDGLEIVIVDVSHETTLFSGWNLEGGEDVLESHYFGTDNIVKCMFAAQETDLGFNIRGRSTWWAWWRRGRVWGWGRRLCFARSVWVR
jgi:hypothetical protein